MKNTCLIVNFIFCIFNLFGQNDKNDFNEMYKMINDALLFKIESNENFIKGSSLEKTYFTNYFILTDNFPANFKFSKEIKDKKIKFLTLKGVKNLRLSKVLRFDGFRLNACNLELNFSEVTIEIKKRRKYIGVGEDWLKFVYHYSCDEVKWKLIKAINGRGEEDISLLKLKMN